MKFWLNRVISIVFKKIVFPNVKKLKKCLTNSIANRSPPFGVSSLCIKMSKKETLTVTEARHLRADFKKRRFARKPVLRTDRAGDAQHCIWQNIYQNRKMPDKSSRLAAAFVRHLIQFKRKIFFLFFIAIPLWQASLRKLFQLCLRSLDQCCKQLMRLRNKAQPIPTCC